MKKNFILITSILKPPDTPFTYSKKRSVFTSDERFDQTKKTITEARKKIPDVTIMLIEASKLTDKQNTYFKQNTDLFYNLIDTDLIEHIYSKHKAKAEFTQIRFGLTKFFELYGSSSKYVHFFKQCGRYYFNDKFIYEQYDNNNIVAKKINNNINNIYTSAYKIPVSKLPIFLDFIITNDKLLTKEGAEPFFANFIKANVDDVKFVDKIYNDGYVSVCGTFHSG